MPLISIICPCYNQAQYLDECLQSVLDQTFSDWECIIVNDGSPDNTEEVARKWIERDQRFKYLKQKNKGVSAARNLGIRHAEGNYFQFLDGDDKLQKNKLLYQIKILESNGSIDVLYGGSRYFKDKNPNNLFAIHPTGIVPTVDMHFDDANQLEILLNKNLCTICAALYRSVIFEKVNFKNVAFEDYLLNIEIAAHHFKFHFQKEVYGNCLVRLTDESQMVRHLSSERYNSLFNREREKIKSGLRMCYFSQYKTKNSLNLKEKIAMFIPPIFFIIKNRLHAK